MKKIFLLSCYAVIFAFTFSGCNIKKVEVFEEIKIAKYEKIIKSDKPIIMILVDNSENLKAVSSKFISETGKVLEKNKLNSYILDINDIPEEQKVVFSQRTEFSGKTEGLSVPSIFIFKKSMPIAMPLSSVEFSKELEEEDIKNYFVANKIIEL